MDKTTPLPNPAEADRRQGDDRRRVDGTPPGRHDRRRGLESRKPDVVELEMTNSEWAALSAEPPPAK